MNEEWRDTFVLLGKTDFLTGKRIRFRVMVRSVNGEKQYREMSEDEAKALSIDNAV